MSDNSNKTVIEVTQNISLEVETENLAVPEIHVIDTSEEGDAKAGKDVNSAGSDAAGTVEINYSTAVPEYHSRKR